MARDSSERLHMAIQLRDFMTHTPVYVRAESGLGDVQELFEKHSFRHLPVLIEDQVVGIISERDVHLALSLATDPEAVAGLTAADICSPDPYTAEVYTPFSEVVRVMGERKIGAAIITDEGVLAGIITTTDVCRICARLLDAVK